MPNPPRIHLRGDLLAADRLRLRHGYRLLEEFRRLTAFQSLQQNERLVRFEDESYVHLATRFGQEEVLFYVPPPNPNPEKRQLPGAVSYHLWLPATTKEALMGGLLCVAPGLRAYTEPFEWFDQRYLAPDGWKQITDEERIYLGPIPIQTDGLTQGLTLTDVPPYTAASGYTYYDTSDYEEVVTLWDTLTTWKEGSVWFGAWTTHTRITHNLWRKHTASGTTDLVHGPVVANTYGTVTKAEWSESYDPAVWGDLGGGVWTEISGTSTGETYWIGGVGAYHPGIIRGQTAAEAPEVYGVTFAVCRQASTTDGTDEYPLVLHEAWQYVNIQGTSHEVASSSARELSNEYEGWACARGEAVLYHWLFAPVAENKAPFMLYRLSYTNRLGEIWYGVAATDGNTLLKLPASGVMETSLDLYYPLRVVRRELSEVIEQ